ncbi:MAG: hypothetical protein ABR575_03295 [Actinomycetota bacterium]
MTGNRRRVIVPLAVVALAVVGFGVVVPATGSQGRRPIGNHTFQGRYTFAADGVLEQDGTPGRGFWELGSFKADGNGNMSGGVEYSNLLTDDEAQVNVPFTFTGTYTVNPDATGSAQVEVVIPGGPTLNKTVWFVLHDIEDGVAHGFWFAHGPAQLGNGLEGRAGVHHAARVRSR